MMLPSAEETEILRSERVIAVLTYSFWVKGGFLVRTWWLNVATTRVLLLCLPLYIKYEKSNESLWFFPFLGIEFVVFFVGAKGSIEDVENCSIIADVLLVMEVMVGSSGTEGEDLGLSPRPVIATMSIQPFDDPKRQPNDDGEDVHGIHFRQLQPSQSSRQSIG